MDISTIRFRVIILEAQKKGLEAELKALREIRCPVCYGKEGSGGLGNIAIRIPNESTGGEDIRWEMCQECNGSGYACGEFMRYY